LVKDIYLRLDYHHWAWRLRQESFRNSIKLRHVIKYLENGHAIERKDYAEYETDYVHIVPRNLHGGGFVGNNLIFLKEDKGEHLKRFRVMEKDVLLVISSNCGEAFCFNLDSLPEYLRDKNFTLSHYIVKISATDNINPKVLTYYLNSLKPYFRAVETGKTQKNLPLYYVYNIPISKQFTINQDKVLSKTSPIEKEITHLRIRVKKPKETIDKILSQKFGYALDEFEEPVKTFGLKLSDLSRSLQLRLSTKFNHPKYEGFFKILEKHKTIRLKKVLSEPSKLGKSPEYDDEGKARYISADVIKELKIDLDGAKTLSDDFYAKYKYRYSLKKWDLLMARSGEGTIGKVALFEYDTEEYPAIFSDFTMRIRPDSEKINPQYLYYYMISFLFQPFVEMKKKGMGNMTNIFPSQVETVPLICPSLKEQNRIVNKIEAKITEQRNLQMKLNRLELEIERIVAESLLAKD